MIPRFKPAIGATELTAAMRPQPGAVSRFEQAFAEEFGTSHGIAFNYGRGALFALCKALGLTNAEVIVPAYTCSVVAHAVVLSGNRCRFVDREAGGYNMDLAQLEAAITADTRMVLATHLFGIPADVDRLRAIADRASARWGHKIWVVQDCAHSFGAEWHGRLVTAAGDIALFGLGISKVMTSIFGGMLTTNDGELAGAVRQYRDARFASPSISKRRTQQAYLVASTAAFSSPCYGFVRWLQDETALLDGLTKAYHLDGQIRLPPDAFDQMSDVEAQVGLAQLGRYRNLTALRREHAHYYRDRLEPPEDWVLPPNVEGATYSHFPVRVEDRAATLRYFLDAGIQLGQLIEYSIPHLSEYGSALPSAFPNAWDSSQHTINLPVHPSMSRAALDRVIDVTRRIASRGVSSAQPAMGSAR